MRACVSLAAVFVFLNFAAPLLFGQSESAIYGIVAAKADGSVLPNSLRRWFPANTRLLFLTRIFRNRRFGSH
ncbi:MAG: hypothetical protein DMG17_02215 [Acidobacteria bacterium]|nr:MAG: hypothetical protein DMG17_02215 [Acidobacteriota bacterium]